MPSKYFTALLKPSITMVLKVQELNSDGKTPALNGIMNRRKIEYYNCDLPTNEPTITINIVKGATGKDERDLGLLY